MSAIIIIFLATMFYNIINGMSSIFIAKGLIKYGALFDGLRNIIYILILSFVLLKVKENYWLLIPLFAGYSSGMMISGHIIDRMKLGEITITAMVNGDKYVAKDFAEALSDQNIMNTSFIGTGSKSKTVAIVVITDRKNQDKTIRHIKKLAKEKELSVKVTLSDSMQWTNN